MTKREYDSWCDFNGYINYTDWNYQVINYDTYFWIINPKTDKFALIKQQTIGYHNVPMYTVLVSEWTDFNGWAEAFHAESENTDD